MIISIISYRGGSGKTLFSLNLAAQLNIFNKTILVEADFLAPTLQYLVENYIDKIEYTWNDYLLGRCSISAIVNPIKIKNYEIPMIFTRQNNDDILMHFHNRAVWMDKFSRKIVHFFNQQKAEHHDVIIDNQNGMFLATATHAFFSDFLIVILRPSFTDVKGTLTFLEALDTPYFLVWNSTFEKIEPEIEQWNRMFQQHEHFKGELARIPFDEETAYLNWAKNIPIIENTIFHEKIKQIAERITNERLKY